MIYDKTMTTTTTTTTTTTRQRPQTLSSHQRIGGYSSYTDDPFGNNFGRTNVAIDGGGGNSSTFDDENDKKYMNLSLARRLWKHGGKMLQEACNACGRDVNTATDNYLYYTDRFNDLSWSCSAGTSDDNGIWLNQKDPAGTIMAALVWVLIGYSALTMTLLAQTGGIPVFFAEIYCILAALALSCHIKTSLTDPGAVPSSAVPTESQRVKASQKLTMCSQCQTFKPPASHHCRICGRCIARMDHHCPWMNNCVGAGNMKHFLLFLLYTWAISAFALVLMGWNYFFCADNECEFTTVLTQLVRIMTVLCIGSFLFTSSMIMNVVYGLMTGIGTIDRLKKKAAGTMQDADEAAIPLKDVFGIGPAWQWFLPVDPLFDDYDAVMGFSTPQRLLREQVMKDQRNNVPTADGVANGGDAHYLYNNHHDPHQHHILQHGHIHATEGSVVTMDSYGAPV